MIDAAWQRARGEWRGNRRLRLAGMAALVFLGIHLLLAMGDLRQEWAGRYGRDVELQARFAGMQDQKDWPERAEQAEAGLAEMRARVPAVTSAGLAQAEMQAWLTALAASNGLSESRVKVEDTLDVPGYPEMWQVMARLDGKLPQYGQAGFLRELSQALPWIQAERLEIGEDEQARVLLVVRGYYRQAGDDEPVVEAAPGDADIPAAAPEPPPMPSQFPPTPPVEAADAYPPSSPSTVPLPPGQVPRPPGGGAP